MEPSYAFFDHTADIGLRVRAATLVDLLQPAGEGLYAIIGELVAGETVEPVTLKLSADDPATLLRDYLAELLQLLDRDQCIATLVGTATFEDRVLIVTLQTAQLDPDRSEFHREVKAITYHELDIRSIPGGLEATIIVDV